MKVTIKGCVAFGKFDWEMGTPAFRFFEFDPNDRDFAKVADHSIVIDVPDDFDPRSQMVQNLEREKAKITAAFQKRITEINGQIQSLLAIENHAEVL